jgi:hypothetical protein
MGKVGLAVGVLKQGGVEVQCIREGGGRVMMGRGRDGKGKEGLTAESPERNRQSNLPPAICAKSFPV